MNSKWPIAILSFIFGSTMLTGSFQYGHKYAQAYGYPIPFWFLFAGIGIFGICVIISCLIILEKEEKNA